MSNAAIKNYYILSNTDLELWYIDYSEEKGKMLIKPAITNLHLF